MHIFFIIVGVISFISSIVLFVLNKKYETIDELFTIKSPSTYFDDPMKTIHSSGGVKLKPLAIACLVAAFLLLTTGNSFKIVPTGYTGVRTTFGQISEKTVQKGFNFKVPFIQSIELVNNKQQDTKISSEVWGEAKDKTPVYASNIVVTYQINPEKSSWIYSNVSDYENMISADVVASAVKSAMVELDALNVTNRSKIEPAVKNELAKSLNEKYGEDTISIFKVVINQMDFEKAYNDAIAQKSLAQKKQEQQAIENKTAVDKAKADKEVAIQKAEADAQSKIIKAEAEAESNIKISKSLTDGVLKSKFYEKWNGQLPKVTGNGSVITDISDVTPAQ